MQALKEAIKKAGGVQKFADTAGVSRAAVYFWLAGKREMSPETAIQIEKAMGLDRRRLLPHIFGR